MFFLRVGDEIATGEIITGEEGVELRQLYTSNETKCFNVKAQQLLGF
jgi:hypothetical protein